MDLYRIIAFPPLTPKEMCIETVIITVQKKILRTVSIFSLTIEGQHGLTANTSI